jgi:hypothetical protein
MGYENPGKGQPPERGGANVGPDKKPVDPKIPQALGKAALAGKK